MTVRMFPVIVAAMLAASCGQTPTAPSSSATISDHPAAPGTAVRPFVLTLAPETIWVGVGRQSGQLDGIVVPNQGIWRMEVRATGTLYGSIKRVEQVLQDRESRVKLGAKVELGPFLAAGNTPVRVFDPLKTNGVQTFNYNLDLGFNGRPADLLTTIVVEDAGGTTWTLEHTMRWELLETPTPTSPVNLTVRQNDPASGCPFDPVHGYGFVLDLSWNPPPPNVPVTSYSISVLDGAGRDLINTLHFPTETRLRLLRCGVHVGSGAERGARFGVRTYHAPSHGMSAFAVARFDFQPCRDAGVPACQ